MQPARRPDPLAFRTVRWMVVGAVLFTAVAFAWALVQPPKDAGGPTYRQMQGMVVELQEEVVRLKGQLAQSQLREEELRSRLEKEGE